MLGFDQKVLHLAHDSNEMVSFTLEVDFMGRDQWNVYQEITVDRDQPHKPVIFPLGFQAQWTRFKIDKKTTATAFFIYQ